MTRLEITIFRGFHLSKTFDVTMQWGNTNLMADLIENIGLKLKIQS